MGRHETGLMDVVKFSRCTGSDSRGSLGPRDSISRSCIGIGIAVNYARRISFTFFSTNFCQISKYPRDLYRRVISKGRKDFLFFFFSLGFEKFFPSGKYFYIFLWGNTVEWSFKICIDFCRSFDYSIEFFSKFFCIWWINSFNFSRKFKRFDSILKYLLYFKEWI